ncbi:hypothetical protein EDC04DRAFT_1243252 [Pisolithus marmoratus]|nr:hypothetical protein EDC04DRAFT_1243252 [Pisolithus marmoratus]
MSDRSSSSWQAALQSETATPSLPGQALPSTSTVQHVPSPGIHCQLGYEHRGATGFSTLDAQAPQRPTPTGNVSAVSTEWPGYPAVLSQRQVPYSSLAGHPNGEQDSARFTSPLGCIAGQNEDEASFIVSPLVDPSHVSSHVTNHDTAPSVPQTNFLQLYAVGYPPRYPQENESVSTFEDLASFSGCIAGQNEAASIVSPLVDQGRGYWDTQDHVSSHVTNHDTVPSAPQTNFLQLYAVGYPPRYPQENGNVSTFEDLDHGSTGPTTGLSSISAFHDHTSGQVGDSNAPWPQLSSPFFLSPQELRSSDGFTSDNIPLRPEQMHTMMEARAQFPSGFTSPEIIDTPPSAPYSYVFPTPLLSNSTPYSTTDDSTSCSSVMPSPIASSQFPQGHLGTLVPAHSLHMKPADFSASQEFHAGSDMELYTTGTDNNHMVHVVGDHLLFTPSDHSTGDYGNFDKSQVAGPRLQSSLPLNQHLLSPYKHHSHGQVSRIKGESQSRTAIKPSGARSVCRSNVPIVHCGWRNDTNEECGAPITLNDCRRHFADVHGIKNIARHVKIACRWCPLELEKEIVRKNFPRHLMEVHLHCPRQENRYTALC